jgi:hypothetical protein
MLPMLVCPAFLSSFCAFRQLTVFFTAVAISAGLNLTEPGSWFVDFLFSCSPFSVF